MRRPGCAAPTPRGLPSFPRTARAWSSTSSWYSADIAGRPTSRFPTCASPTTCPLVCDFEVHGRRARRRLTAPAMRRDAMTDDRELDRLETRTPTASAGSRSTGRQLGQRAVARGAAELAALLEQIAAQRAARAGAALRQDERLHRRGRHQGIHDAAHARGAALRSSRCGQAVLDRLEALPCPTRGRHPRLRPRRRTGTRAGLPLPDRASATASCRSGCRKCSWASTRALAARCARCGCSACGRRWS